MKLLLKNFNRSYCYRAFDSEKLIFGPEREVTKDNKPTNYDGEYVSFNGKRVAYFTESREIFVLVSNNKYRLMDLQVGHRVKDKISQFRIKREDEIILDEFYVLDGADDFPQPAYENELEDFGLWLTLTRERRSEDPTYLASSVKVVNNEQLLRDMEEL